MQDYFIQVCAIVNENQTCEIPKSEHDNATDFLIEFIEKNFHNDTARQITPVFIEGKMCLYKRTNDRFVIIEDKRGRIRVIVVEIQNKDINLIISRSLHINKDMIMGQDDITHLLYHGKLPE